MDELLKFLFAFAGGGFGIKLLDWILNSRKYSAELNRISSEEWKQLYSEVKKTLVEQEIKLDKLQVTCDQLRLENIKLQQQYGFQEAINKM